MAQVNSMMMAQRYKAVAEMLLREKHRPTVERAVRKQWGYSKYGARRLCTYVVKTWRAQVDADIKEMAALAIAERNSLIEKAEASGDLKTALLAMDSRDRILGVLVDKIGITGSVKHTHEHSLDVSQLALARTGEPCARVIDAPKAMLAEPQTTSSPQVDE